MRKLAASFMASSCSERAVVWHRYLRRTLGEQENSGAQSRLIPAGFNKSEEKSNVRDCQLSLLGATLVLGAAAMVLSAEANAATRRDSQSPPTRAQGTPIIRQDHTYATSGHRDVNSISGTPRWNYLGTAP
jgi:hypothetical protein